MGNNKKLALYAMAATGLIAGNAGAAVVSKTSNQSLSDTTDKIRIDINEDGTDDLELSLSTNNPPTKNKCNLNALNSNSIFNTSAGDRILLEKLSTDYVINTNTLSRWQASGMAAYYSKSDGLTNSYGEFLNATGYAGFRLKLSGSYHYGWIKLGANASADTCTVYEWSYENSSGTSIKAGETGSEQGSSNTTTSVPALGPYGMYILASLILLAGAVRRRKT